jgi:hypothetical protein
VNATDVMTGAATPVTVTPRSLNDEGSLIAFSSVVAADCAAVSSATMMSAVTMTDPATAVIVMAPGTTLNLAARFPLKVSLTVLNEAKSPPIVSCAWTTGLY